MSIVTAARLSCLIVDDHPALLDGLARYLRAEGIDVVGQAASGAEAVAIAERRRTAVALVDLKLPDLNGLDVVRSLTRSATACVLYSGYTDLAQARAALDAGARGVLSKEAPLADIARALNVVAAGELYVDPVLGGQLARTGTPETALTVRERQILRCLAEGMTNEEIGAQLFLSPETVRTHVRKATARLGARNRTQAVALALREQVIG